ncbi:MAG: hypothetical protein EBS53_04910 [Bacteroidetes bacterium]|nr:hypothetical protein [Bacteroidota bacterium]
MPATNYTPIQLYRSTSSGTVPNAANLSPGEIALNIADNDMTMYFENATGTVKRFFNNPAALKYPTADGTSGQVLKTDGAGVLSFGSAASSALTNNTRQAVTSSSTTTINLNSGNVIDLTMAASIATLSFTNVPASGTPILIQIVVRNASDGTVYTIVWPNSVYWSGQYSLITNPNIQVAPTLATGANGITVIALLTTDGGTKWRGWVEATIPGGTGNQLYGWGNNDSGEIGVNDTVRRSSPVQVGALTDWAIIAGVSTSRMSIKTDGTLWAWGSNSYGQLGLNNNTNMSSPVQVGALTNWAQIAQSIWCAAIKTDGTLWTWGYNGHGMLMQNDRVSRSSPVQVGASTDWAFVDVAASTIAIKTNGTLWVAGRSDYGQLGQNNTQSRSSPTQLGALTTWASASAGGNFNMAIKTDGTLWGWGNNIHGNLGNSNNTNMSSPVQVGALTNWSSISASAHAYMHCLAIKTDGSLWSWGNNNNGQLGRNNTINVNSPNQIGALTTWSQVTTGRSMSAAIKTDGTLWVWGNNSRGQLGLNDVTIAYGPKDRSSPVQVGALTTWGNVRGAYFGTVAKTQSVKNPA